MKKPNSKKKMKLILIPIIIILIAVIVFLIILPPSSGKLPKGHVLAEKTKVEVDGAELGLILLSDNTDNPVLLVCGGGPGIPQYLLESLYPSVLPEYFTVCYCDYRGTGLSYDSNVDPDSVTTERIISDVLAVTDYLKERFHKDQIYIMGHSFGTYVALRTVAQYPDNYIAYLAMSQTCDQYRSEVLAYDYMRECYVKQGNQSMVDKFDAFNIKESEEDYKAYTKSSLRDKAMHSLGVGTTSDMHDVISGLFFPSLRIMAYTQRERINIWKGKGASNHFAVRLDSGQSNAFEDVPSVEIPVYFFAGENDMTCCTSLQKEYYEALKAPEKQFYLYEGCAHSPIYEDPEKTREILDEIIKK